MFLGIHARTDIRIDISISIGPISIEFGKQVYLQELSQMGIIKQMLVMPSLQDHVTN